MARWPGPVEVLRVLEQQVEVLAELPATLLALNRSLRRLARTVERVDALLDEIEEPVRALGPGLRRVATVLDDPVIEQVPEMIRGLRDAQGTLAAISTFADETTARLAALPGAGLLRWSRRDPPAPPRVEPD